MGALVVTFHPHWANRRRLRSISVPYVEVGGAEYECSWTHATRVPMRTGNHTVRTFWRDTRRVTTDGGAGQGSFAVAATGDTHVDTYNRIGRASPFVPRLGSTRVSS